jgi:hypothetical protein
MNLVWLGRRLSQIWEPPSRRKLLVDDFASFLQHANFASIIGEGVGNPAGHLFLFGIQHYIGAVNGCFLSNNLSRLAFLLGLDVLGTDVDPFHDYLALFGVNAEDFAHFAAIFPAIT